MGNFADHAQFPLNAVGPSAQHAFVGVQRVFFTGSTGLIGTMFGVPGITGATRVSTGLYRFSHDPAYHLDIIPGIESPTGTQYQTNVLLRNRNNQGQQGQSGMFEVQLNQAANAGFGTGLASGFIQPQNPATGTALKLLVYASRVTAF